MLVEGQTEETVVREVLEPYLRNRGVWVTQSILVTRRVAGGSWHHGGATWWARVAYDIRTLLRDSSLDILTTLIDYYGFPNDAPGMVDRPRGSPEERVRHVENALAVEFADPRFVPNLVLHEIEAWVYAAVDQLELLYGDPVLAATLRAELAEAGGAESINEGLCTAPSKRLLNHCPGYVKTIDGPLAIAELGIPELRQRCPHVDRWLGRICG